MITILYISDSDKHFKEAIKEYEKRLGKQIKLKIIKPVKHGSQQEIIGKETVKINEKLIKYNNEYKVMLSINGENINTKNFVKMSNKNIDIVFIIGGPYGLDERLLDIDRKISFGYMTMPHGLIKLVLLEQIYRSICIKIGKKYHY